MISENQFSGSWEVASIINEPLQTVLRFCAWHLAAGAEKITLYFDNPDDPVIPMLEGTARIASVRCTPEFWLSASVRPSARFVKRQNAAMTYAYKQASAAWFACIDADELFYLRGRSIASLLESIEPDVSSVRFPTAEAIQTNAANTAVSEFRLRMNLPQVRAVYESERLLFKQRAGLVGHNRGKSITRVGMMGVKIRQHWAEKPGSERLPERHLEADEKAYLLHFMDQDFQRWLDKLKWRVSARGFKGRIEDRVKTLLEAGADKTEFEQFYNILYFFDDQRLERLQAQNAYLGIEADFDTLVKRYFPGIDG